MNTFDGIAAWKNLKRRLVFSHNVLGCCGVTIVTSDPRTAPGEQQPFIANETATTTITNGQGEQRTGMNLATALARERNRPGEAVEQVVPSITLMSLIEEADGVEYGEPAAADQDAGAGELASDWICCVCMERNKGAAFIPCGHAFCRVCSRELWRNRYTCPMCDRPVLDILDIF